MAADFAKKYVKNYQTKGGEIELVKDVLKLLRRTPKEAAAAAAAAAAKSPKASTTEPDLFLRIKKKIGETDFNKLINQMNDKTAQEKQHLFQKYDTMTAEDIVKQIKNTEGCVIS